MKQFSAKQNLIRNALLNYPGKSNREIAKILKLSHTSVDKFRNEYALKLDADFVAMTAGTFIQTLRTSHEFWDLKIDELETIKNGKKTVIKQNPEDGTLVKDEVDLDPMEKLAYIKEQSVIKKYIIDNSSLGELSEVLKVMRSGKLPILKLTA